MLDFLVIDILTVQFHAGSIDVYMILAHTYMNALHILFSTVTTCNISSTVLLLPRPRSRFAFGKPQFLASVNDINHKPYQQKILESIVAKYSSHNTSRSHASTS